MDKPKVMKVSRARTMVPDVLSGRLVFVPEQLPPGSQTLPGAEDLGPWLPTLPVEVGDKIVREGYIERISFNEFGYVADPHSGRAEVGNNQLKLQTYCLVELSAKANAEADLTEFRILYTNVTGEKLAASMAVVAALKDAFLHRAKVRVYAEARLISIGAMLPPSDIYLALQAVELLRS
jgi:hypothetical protein